METAPPKPVSTAHCSMGFVLCDRVTSLSPFHSENDCGCPWIVVISTTQKWDDVLKWCRKSDHPPKLNFRLIFPQTPLNNQAVTMQRTVCWWTLQRLGSSLSYRDNLSHIHTQRGEEFKCWPWNKNALAQNWSWGLCSAWYKHYRSGYLH